MSSSHRSLARLPSDIFENLQSRAPGEEVAEADLLKRTICSKLKQADMGSKFGTKKNITTVGELLRLSIPALLRALDPVLTYEECLCFVERLSISCAPAPTSALKLLRETVDVSDPKFEPQHIKHIRSLASGMSSLDKNLRGGFRLGTITEIVGRAGVGKTQLAMQLCTEAARYGLGCVYLDTENKLSLRRLKEIAEERALAFNSVAPTNQAGSMQERDTDFYYSEEPAMDAGNQSTTSVHQSYKRADIVMENVTVHCPSSTSELLAAVVKIEEEILIRNQDAEQSLNESTPRPKFPVGLVVIDSIAAGPRRDPLSAHERVALLFQIAQRLKRTADQLHVAVVVINQVELYSENTERNLMVHQNGSDFVKTSAALGTSWHHCVSTRLLLEFERDPHRLNSTLDDVHEKVLNQSNGNQSGVQDAWRYARGQVRTATVVKSNVVGLSTMKYEVTTLGLADKSI